jgi:molecular chaperone GrpE
MPRNRHASVRSGADAPDRATRPASSGDPTSDSEFDRPGDGTLTDALAEEKQEGREADEPAERPGRSVPAGEPEAPTGPAAPSRPHGDELDEVLPDEQSGAPAEPEDHERKLQRDLEELETKAGKADQYLELAQRTKADFENYRRRAAREASAAQERGIAKLAKELLPAVDNLDRALEAAQAASNGAEDETTLVSGIKLVHADVLAALARVGIERFDPEGEQFDPQCHEAVAQQPVEGARPGTIVEVYQRGYRLGEAVLRPARVVVAG